MATKKAKPNGQFRLRTAEAEAVMAELKVTELPGVGRSVGQNNRAWRDSVENDYINPFQISVAGGN